MRNGIAICLMTLLGAWGCTQNEAPSNEGGQDASPPAEDMTIVSITHRLEIAATFDRMLEMHNGALREASGTELMPAPSPFAVQAGT